MSNKQQMHGCLQYVINLAQPHEHIASVEIKQAREFFQTTLAARSEFGEQAIDPRTIAEYSQHFITLARIIIEHQPDRVAQMRKDAARTMALVDEYQQQWNYIYDSPWIKDQLAGRIRALSAKGEKWRSLHQSFEQNCISYRQAMQKATQVIPELAEVVEFAVLVQQHHVHDRVGESLLQQLQPLQEDMKAFSETASLELNKKIAEREQAIDSLTKLMGDYAAWAEETLEQDGEEGALPADLLTATHWPDTLGDYRCRHDLIHDQRKAISLGEDYGPLAQLFSTLGWLKQLDDHSIPVDTAIEQFSQSLEAICTAKIEHFHHQTIAQMQALQAKIDKLLQSVSDPTETEGRKFLQILTRKELSLTEISDKAHQLLAKQAQKIPALKGLQLKSANDLARVKKCYAAGKDAVVSAIDKTCAELQVLYESKADKFIAVYPQARADVKKELLKQCEKIEKIIQRFKVDGLVSAAGDSHNQTVLRQCQAIHDSLQALQQRFAALPIPCESLQNYFDCLALGEAVKTQTTAINKLLSNTIRPFLQNSLHYQCRKPMGDLVVRLTQLRSKVAQYGLTKTCELQLALIDKYADHVAQEANRSVALSPLQVDQLFDAFFELRLLGLDRLAKQTQLVDDLPRQINLTWKQGLIKALGAEFKKLKAVTDREKHELHAYDRLEFPNLLPHNPNLARDYESTVESVATLERLTELYASLRDRADECPAREDKLAVFTTEIEATQLECDGTAALECLNRCRRNLQTQRDFVNYRLAAERDGQPTAITLVQQLIGELHQEYVNAHISRLSVQGQTFLQTTIDELNNRRYRYLAQPVPRGDEAAQKSSEDRTEGQFIDDVIGYVERRMQAQELDELSNAFTSRIRQRLRTLLVSFLKKFNKNLSPVCLAHRTAKNTYRIFNRARQALLPSEEQAQPQAANGDDIELDRELPQAR